MKNSKLIWQSFLQSTGVFIYVAGISALMINGDKIFGKMQNLWGPMMFLMLFVISALITSLLVFGRPVYLYFEGQKKDGVALLFWTAGWLVLMTILIFTATAAITLA
ncbi:MAG: hypothetical protein WC323_03935 [Patescibacteria group bacterium]|jgi:hypothetical protein